MAILEGLQIDADRLQAELEELSRFTTAERAAEGTAVTRVVFTDDDMRARESRHNSPWRTASQSFTVTVNDTDLALSGLPANISTNATSPAGALVSYTPPTAVDEESPAPTVTCAPASGSTFPIGPTTVTCTAIDGDDLSSPVGQTFTVTVRDTDVALNGTPANVVTNATSTSGAVVLYAPPTVVDEDSSAPTVTCSPASGTMFAVGTTTVACAASFDCSRWPLAEMTRIGVPWPAGAPS